MNEVMETLGKTIIITAGVIVVFKVYGCIKYAQGYVKGYQEGTEGS